MGKKVKTTRALFYFALAAIFLGCNNTEELRGVYKTEDVHNDSVEFFSNFKVIVNLDGERLEGTYKLTDKTILITVKNSMKLVVLTLVDRNTIVRRYYGAQVFFRK